MTKKILITGINSYVGNSFAEICKDDFDITKISLRDDSWKNLDFSQYDSILHVAAIVHNSENADKERYFSVNTELAIDVAEKARQAGVKQFVLLSTMAVYGEEGSLNSDIVINKDTIPKPNSFYGDSKLQAEIKLKSLESDNFDIAIIRPPMVYGDGSKGNYPKLVKIAKYAFMFPDIDNKRSVISIYNLSNEIGSIIESNQRGLFLPQDDEYFCTSQFIENYRKNVLGKKTYLTKAFNPIIRLLAKKVGFINKVFGNLCYKD